MNMKPINQSLRHLRSLRRLFRQNTFSFNDLKRHGMIESEIEHIQSTTKFNEKRYEKYRVWEFLTYQKK